VATLSLVRRSCISSAGAAGPQKRARRYFGVDGWRGDAARRAPHRARAWLRRHFGHEGEAANPVDPARAAKANLDYLALGDWHRTLQVGPAIWYAGTPEPDRAGGQEQGTALLVDIARASAVYAA
jgi:hypothetical protein